MIPSCIMRCCLKRRTRGRHRTLRENRTNRTQAAVACRTLAAVACTGLCGRNVSLRGGGGGGEGPGEGGGERMGGSKEECTQMGRSNEEWTQMGRSKEEWT